MEALRKKGLGKKNGASRSALIGFLFVLPAVFYFLAVYMYPFIETIKMSFTLTVKGVTSFAGWGNYREVLSDSLFWKSLSNTLKLTLYSVPITIVLAMAASLLMDKMPSKGMRNTLQITSLLPMMVSLIAASLIFQWIFDPSYGIINRALSTLGLDKQKFMTSKAQVLPTLSVITIWIRVGFNATILLAGLQSIPQHYYEAAKIDGSSAVNSFFKITVPLLNSQLVLVMITEIIFSTKTFEQVYITTSGGPINSSRTIIIHLYETAFKFQKYEEASVIAVILFVILMLISVFQWVFARKEITY